MKRLTLFLDTETGGLNPKENDVLTFAYNIDKDKETLIRLQYNVKANPKRVTPEALEINKINLEEHNKAAWSKEEVADHFIKTLKLLEPCEIRLVGQNILFDLRFLEHNIFNKGNNPFIKMKINDTVLLSRKYSYKNNINLPNHKLSTLSEHFGYKTEFHDAMNDVLATRHVYYKLTKK